MGIMKAPSVRDKKKRKLVLKNEEKKTFLKCLKINKSLNCNWWSRLKLSSLAYYKTNSRCVETGRGKAVNKTFKLSRHEFRRWANSSKLPGLEKSSW